MASLPVGIREALERGDEAALEEAFKALSPEEQQVVMEAMALLQEWAEGAAGDEDEEGEDEE